MAKTKYRVIKPGLNIRDDKGKIHELEVGEEFSYENLPEFFFAKVEEVNAEDSKDFEVATPAPEKASKKKD